MYPAFSKLGNGCGQREIGEAKEIQVVVKVGVAKYKVGVINKVVAVARVARPVDMPIAKTHEQAYIFVNLMVKGLARDHAVSAYHV